MSKKCLVESNMKVDNAYEIRVEKRVRTPETAQYKDTQIWVVGNVFPDLIKKDKKSNFIEIDHFLKYSPDINYYDLFRQGRFARERANLKKSSRNLEDKIIFQKGLCIAFASQRVYPYQRKYSEYGITEYPGSINFQEWGLTQNVQFNWNLFKDENLDNFMKQLKKEKYDIWVGEGDKLLERGKGIQDGKVYESWIGKEGIENLSQNVIKLIKEIDNFNHLKETDLFDIVPLLYGETYR